MANTDHILKKPHIPYEMWVQILSHVEPHASILECRRVCKRWKHIVENEIWIHKIRRRKPRDYPIKSISEENEFIRNTPWFILFKITWEDDIFQRNNLIGKNGWGQDLDRNEHWQSYRSNLDLIYRYTKKTFADSDLQFSPEMSEDIGENRYYVTGVRDKPYHYYYKNECIELPGHGLTAFILDQIQPDFTVGLWVCYSPGSEEEVQLPFRSPMSYISAAIISSVNFSEGKSFKVCLAHDNHLENNKWTKLKIKCSKYGVQLKMIRISHCAWTQSDWIKSAGLTVRFQTEKFYEVCWKSLMMNNCFTYTPTVPSNSSFSNLYAWYSNWEIIKKKPFGRNLLPPCMQPRPCLNHCDDLSCSVLRTNKWHACTLHKYCGSDDIVDTITVYTCKIDLRNDGLSDFIQDELQPHIIVCHRLKPKDLESVNSYELTISLWDKEERLVASQTVHGNTKTIMPRIKIKLCRKGERYLVFSVKMQIIAKRYFPSAFVSSHDVSLSLNDD